MNIMDILHSGGVTRFHAVPGMPAQQLDGHQWKVAMIAQFIEPTCSKKVLMAALTHDCAEVYTGDIPHVVKMEVPEMKALSNRIEERVLRSLDMWFELTLEEAQLLKIADILEGIHTCVLQLEQGNRTALAPLDKWKTLFEEKYLDNKETPDRAKALFLKLRFMAEKLS